MNADALTLFDAPVPHPRHRPIGEPPRGSGASPSRGEGGAAREGQTGPSVPASFPAPPPRHLSRTSDPDTSHAAAAAVKVTEQMLQVLRAYGAGTALLDEAAYAAAGFDTGTHARQRCSDLRRAGLIGRIGRTATTRSGRAAHLCAITDLGRAVLIAHRETQRHTAA